LENALKIWPHGSALYIATNSLQSECDIGLMGNDGRTDAQVASAEWEHAGSLDEALSIFQRLWGERDKSLTQFVEGRLTAQ
jgi:hypothetical protein